MLIIWRRANEGVRLGEHIRVVILAVEHGHPGRVKIGISAPPDVVIARDEILDENSPHYRKPHESRPPHEPM